MNNTVIAICGVIGAAVVSPLAHLAVWRLIPPLSRRSLAKAGHFVSVDGIDTYYEHYGSGPPLILIPPGGAHTSTWRHNIGALSRSHEVWTLDLPGSGYTDKPASFPYTHRSYARVLRRFMDVMRIEKAVVAGQSLGGAVALEFALDFPDRTAGLILIDAGGYSRGVKLGALNPARYPLTHAILMSFSSYPAVIRAFYGSLYRHPARFANDRALVAEACAINRTPNARNAWYWMLRALKFDFAIPDIHRIKTVSTPTLIIWGRDDRIIEVRTARRFHHDIAGSQLVVVDDAGHNPHEEKPDAVNQAIATFLDTMRW